MALARPPSPNNRADSDSDFIQQTKDHALQGVVILGIAIASHILLR
ncbi:MAG: hypothetical protein WA902_17490 [Thermosynechococcaceae cyanobacterium]